MRCVALVLFVAFLVCCLTGLVASHQPSAARASSAALGGFGCDVCKASVDLLQKLIRLNASEDEVFKLAIDICIRYNIPGYRNVSGVCDGIVPEFGPELIYIVTQRVIDPQVVCEDFGACPKPVPSLPFSTETFLPKNQPSFNQGRKPSVQLKSSDTLNFFQISDIHVDPRYKVGTVVDCGLPICCRDGVPNQPSNSSRQFGEFVCDIPFTTLEATFQNMQDLMQTQNIDFIIWTGDTPPHDIWEENQDMQLSRLQYVTTMIANYFPNITVYPVFGNHDSFPVDQFAPPPLNSWLMDAVSKMWSIWLPSDVQETFLYGGYYTTLIQPKLRLVGLNTMYCDSSNFWLWLNSTDAGQMNWFENVLTDAEANGEKVYVIGHIPPGSASCRTDLPDIYYNLVTRFNETITGQFFGHTHYDMVQVLRDSDTNLLPVGVAYVAPSIDSATTFYGKTNPSYRVYSADPSTFEIQNYAQYYFDLEQANEAGEINFQLEYDALSAYDLPSLSAESWQGLVQRMAANHTTFMTFYQHIGALAAPADATCEDANCIKEVLCNMQSGLSSLYNSCMQE